jgi:hypothetical protein
MMLAAGAAIAAEAKGKINEIDSIANRIFLTQADKNFIFAMSPSNTSGVKIGDLMVGDSVTVFYSSAGKSDVEFNAMSVVKDE